MGGFILPREILVTADVLRSFLWYFLSIRRAERKYEKERRRTAVVPSDNFSALLQPYCMSVKAQTKRACEGYQVYFLLLVEEETRRPS